tara:strand:+ start:735 stop:911 length:177 start_codon:yes stop_codon:yes gene_type:complete
MSIAKMQKRSKQIVANEEKARREHRNNRVKDYIEMKMLKGHSREAATKMAKGLIDSQW